MRSTICRFVSAFGLAAAMLCPALSVIAQPRTIATEAEYNSVIAQAASQADPSEYRGKALATYINGMFYAGRKSWEEVEGLFQAKFDQLAAIDFYAAYLSVLGVSIRTEQLQKWMGSRPANQQAALRKLATWTTAKFNAEQANQFQRANRPIPAYPSDVPKPGQGWGQTTANNTAAAASPAQYFELGIRQYGGKDFAAAVRSFSECLRLDPGKYACYAGRGDAYRQLEKQDEAIADYSRYLQSFPNDAMVVASRGAAYSAKARAAEKSSPYDRSRYAPALADFDAALKLDPGNARIKASSDALRTMLDEKDKYAELTAKKAALENDIAVRVKRIKDTAYAMFVLNNWDLAITGYSTCISSVPTDVECRIGRTLAYLARSKTETSTAGQTRKLALDDVNTVLQADPNSVYALIIRAEIYTVGGSKDLAIADLRNALRIDPNSAEAKEQLNKLTGAP